MDNSRQDSNANSAHIYTQRIAWNAVHSLYHVEVMSARSHVQAFALHRMENNCLNLAIASYLVAKLAISTVTIASSVKVLISYKMAFADASV